MKPVRIAVVGHTNTGKTSLLRTLTRDVGFGEVSDHPAVTRHVEGTALLVDGEALLELYDTPGLEDSMGLLEHLDATGAEVDRKSDRVAVVKAFLQSPEAHGRFSQESKALRQVLECDVALYVIDARDRVLGKHRDELEILSRCARPIVPVLNFTADADARVDEWRDHLSRAGMHAIAEFDFVVIDEHGERRLYQKMQSMLDRRRTVFDAIIDDRAHQRERLRDVACNVVADMLIDVAACQVAVPVEDTAAAERSLKTMMDHIRDREQRTLQQLLELFNFRPGDGSLDQLPITDGRWGMELFAPETMKRFGVRAGSAAAAGAVAGLAIDAMVGGITFGAASATGAAIGALFETGRSYGRRFIDRARGITELRCTETTLHVLAARQCAVITALFQRGHAATEAFTIDDERTRKRITNGTSILGRTLPAEIDRARITPRWSSLHNTNPATATTAQPGRETAVKALAQHLVSSLN